MGTDREPKERQGWWALREHREQRNVPSLVSRRRKVRVTPHPGREENLTGRDSGFPKTSVQTWSRKGWRWRHQAVSRQRGKGQRIRLKRRPQGDTAGLVTPPGLTRPADGRSATLGPQEAARVGKESLVLPASRPPAAGGVGLFGSSTPQTQAQLEPRPRPVEVSARSKGLQRQR